MYLLQFTSFAQNLKTSLSQFMHCIMILNLYPHGLYSWISYQGCIKWLYIVTFEMIKENITEYLILLIDINIQSYFKVILLMSMKEEVIILHVFVSHHIHVYGRLRKVGSIQHSRHFKCFSFHTRMILCSDKVRNMKI